MNVLDRKKVRYCAAWLENMGYTTTLLSENISSDRRSEDEPAVGLCELTVRS
jgi:hypothetical protein